MCGRCEGPGLDRIVRRPCPECLADLERLEHDPPSADGIARAMAARARSGRVRADALGDPGLAELARERIRWAESLARRPREERRGAMLAAFAHAFAVWGYPEAVEDAEPAERP